MKSMLKNVKDHETLLKAVEMASPMPIRYAGAGQMDDTVNGYCDYGRKEIIIRDGMSIQDTIKTATHEISHAIMHNVDVAFRLGVWKERNIREVEAESICFWVCRHFGIDTFDFSFPYITNFGDGIEREVLQFMLKRVNTATRHLTSILEDNIRFLQEMRIDDTLLREDSLVLKVAQPSTDVLSYVIVEGMGKEELLALLNSYHETQGEKGNIEVNTFLEGQGAKLVPWYDFHGLALDHPVDFFDIGYDYEAGVTDAAQLPKAEQVMMLMDRVEYGNPVFDEKDLDLVTEYASGTEDMALIKAFIKDLAVRTQIFHMQEEQKNQGKRHITIEDKEQGNGTADVSTVDYETVIPGLPVSTDNEQWKENRTNEAFFLNQNNSFAVYQIDRNGKGRAYHYMGLEAMRKYHLFVEREDYQMTYCGALNKQDSLDSLFEKYNILSPDEFYGVNMSVSDVVALNQDGKIKTYFVDSFGFMELRGFIRQVEREPIRQETKKVSTKQSVLNALRNRQARLKAQEKARTADIPAQRRKVQEL